MVDSTVTRLNDEVSMSTRVLDPYDDDFGTLASMFQKQRAPEFIKTASRMGSDDVERLPDHAFALVAYDHGEYMRKFACADKAHTAVNVLYLSRYGDQLPHRALTKTAANLCIACHRFGLDVPDWLQKLSEEIEGRPILKTDSTPLLAASPTEGEKYPKERDAKPTMRSDQAAVTNGVIQTKTASWDPYVDVSNAWPESYRHARAERAVAVRGRNYPLDTAEQIKVANAQFEREWRAMHPRDRREAAVLIEKCAHEISLTVGAGVEKYASRTLRDDAELVQVMVERAHRWPEDRADAAAGIAAGLLEKRASLDADEFAMALAELDVATDVDAHWDLNVPDPWDAVLSEKTASTDRTWNLNGQHVSAKDVAHVASALQDKVASALGEEIAEGLAQDPIAVFDSLPLDQQRVIASMGA